MTIMMIMMTIVEFKKQCDQKNMNTDCVSLLFYLRLVSAMHVLQ